jgi:hypothetical protein
MVRTQIQLEEKQLRRLKRLARQEGVPLAAMVRRCVDRFLEKEGSARSDLYDRAAKLVGAFRDSEGKADVALAHDRYLDGAFR